MNLSKSFFVIPVMSFTVAAAVASGACSSSVSVVIPTESTAPEGTTFPDGIVLGESCEGTTYVSASTGYAFCDDGAWAYTADDPSGDSGYTEYTGGSESNSSDSTPSASSSDSNPSASSSDSNPSNSSSNSNSSAGANSSSSAAGASSSSAAAG